MAAWLESAWLARYLERQLDGEELAWFEAYLLDKPELLGMVEADNALRDGLGATERASRPKSSGRPSRMLGAGPLFAAAALVAGIGIGWILGDSGGPSMPKIIPDPTRFTYDTTRGMAGEQPVVEHQSTSAAYVLVEAYVPSEARNIRVLLQGEAARVLLPGADGFVSFLVSAAAAEKEEKVDLVYDLAGNAVVRSLDLGRARGRGN